MAKDRIDRTYTRQGHNPHWNKECREENRRARQEWRTFMRLARQSADPDREREPPRQRKSRDWDNPTRESAVVAKRWLYSQIGRPWDKVYSELRERLNLGRGRNRRLLCQLLREVDVDGQRSLWHVRFTSSPGPWTGELYIDADGILRQAPRQWDRWLAWSDQHCAA